MVSALDPSVAEGADAVGVAGGGSWVGVISGGVAVGLDSGDGVASWGIRVGVDPPQAASSSRPTPDIHQNLHLSHLRPRSIIYTLWGLDVYAYNIQLRYLFYDYTNSPRGWMDFVPSAPAYIYWPANSCWSIIPEVYDAPGLELGSLKLSGGFKLHSDSHSYGPPQG